MYGILSPSYLEISACEVLYIYVMMPTVDSLIILSNGMLTSEQWV